MVENRELLHSLKLMAVLDKDLEEWYEKLLINEVDICDLYMNYIGKLKTEQINNKVFITLAYYQFMADRGLEEVVNIDFNMTIHDITYAYALLKLLKRNKIDCNTLQLFDNYDDAGSMTFNMCCRVTKYMVDTGATIDDLRVEEETTLVYFGEKTKCKMIEHIDFACKKVYISNLNDGNSKYVMDRRNTRLSKVISRYYS